MRVWSGVLNWALIMSRNTRLSDSFTYLPLWIKIIPNLNTFKRTLKSYYWITTWIHRNFSSLFSQQISNFFWKHANLSHEQRLECAPACSLGQFFMWALRVLHVFFPGQWLQIYSELYLSRVDKIWVVKPQFWGEIAHALFGNKSVTQTCWGQKVMGDFVSRCLK